jgi:hypothetical protein
MTKQLFTVLGSLTLAAVAAQASPIPQGKYLTCRGEGQTIFVLPGMTKDSLIVQVQANNQMVKISTDFKYSETYKAFVGRVTEDTALKSKGFTPKGPMTLDLNSKRFVVQDPYTGSASVLVSGVQCESTDLAGF